MGRPTPQMSSRLAERRLDLVAPKGPEGVPLFRYVGEGEAGALEQALPDVDVVGREAHRRQVQATPAGGSVEQGGASERVPVEQVRIVTDGVQEVDKPTLVGPSLVG